MWLKRFSDTFDEERGEFILESIDNREKTRPADAINWIVQSPDGFSQAEGKPKLRSIVLLTDGTA